MRKGEEKKMNQLRSLKLGPISLVMLLFGVVYAWIRFGPIGSVSLGAVFLLAWYGTELAFSKNRRKKTSP
jgi:hypothetical protein